MSLHRFQTPASSRTAHVVQALGSSRPPPQGRSPSGRLAKLHLERSRSETSEWAADQRSPPDGTSPSPRALLVTALHSPEFLRRLRRVGYTDDRQDAAARNALLSLQAELLELHESYGFDFLERLVVQSPAWALVDRVLFLAQLLGQESVSDTCHVVRSKPLVLTAETEALVRRLLELKRVLPNAHLGPLISLYPSLLYMELEPIQGAARKMQALMPAYDWMGTLQEGAAAFYSFQALVEDERQTARNNARAPP